MTLRAVLAAAWAPVAAALVLCVPVLCVPGGVAAGATATEESVRAATPTCTLTPGRVTVAVIVQDDALVTRTDCVTVAPSAATGAGVLAARAAAIGAAAPRYDSSGLLCAIDGAPVSGCGETAGDAYLYWSYWIGNAAGSWTYAAQGPATRRLTDGSVEGWRFVRGRGTSSEFAPTTRPTAVRFVAPPQPDRPPPQPTPASPDIAPGGVSGMAPGGGPGTRHPTTPRATLGQTPTTQSAPTTGGELAGAAAAGEPVVQPDEEAVVADAAESASTTVPISARSEVAAGKAVAPTESGFAWLGPVGAVVVFAALGTVLVVRSRHGAKRDRSTG